MPIEKLPSGSRGGRMPAKGLARVLTPLMIRVHRLSGNTMGGQPLLYLTTVGARSGQRRTTPVMRFDQPDGSWVVVASAGGAAAHPGWYHNIAAHPDQVWAEVAGTSHHVDAEQLDGEARARAWADVVRQVPRFQGYTDKTDRPLPVLRLTPTP
jgi:deazaflavin-dependent oxidoreductase (nitroreductase family)